MLTLRKETHFRFNRVYLLFSVFISFIIPLLNIPLYSGKVETGFFGILQMVQVGADNAHKSENKISLSDYIIIIYFIGLTILSVRFVARFIALIILRKKCIIEKKSGLHIALNKNSIAPFSFFNTIFMDEKIVNDEQLDIIILHETIHIRQLHSLDVILAEIICLLTWFNPVSWMIKSALKETHEYLADSGVSEQTPGSSEYFMLLVRNAIGVQPGLANNLNKSLILKRLKMMKKPRSGRFSVLKALPVIPALVMLFMTFSCQSSTDQLPCVTQNDGKTDKVDKMPEFPGGQEAMTKFIIDNVKYPQDAKEKGIQGKVFVSFTVTKTGKLENIRVLKSVNNLLDEEAIRVITLMPVWVPGMSAGVAVDVEMTLPISFKLA
jgi:TonB family protein